MSADSARQPSSFENRLAKNWRHFSKWAQRRALTAFRVYDLDLPDWPYAIDWYAGRAHVIEYPRRRARREGTHLTQRAEVLAAIEQVLGVGPEATYCKTHQPQPWGRQQYGRAGANASTFTVDEGGLRFEVNLGDYLDTGLFMDHRDTRARVRREAKGLKVLNLFAYTGSFTVAAAVGGASATTTVDLSNTYCDWAQRNLTLNGLEVGPRHQVVRADVLRWVEQTRESYDLIVLDPPSYSASKKMERSFNVPRDHRWLIEQVGALLAPGGQLYFSTNFRGFELHPALDAAEELTPTSLPDDFHPGSHRCFLFRA